MSMELASKSWKLAFSDGTAKKPRVVSIDARCEASLDDAIVRAKKRFGLSPDAPVVSCHEAGRDGFSVHRFLVGKGTDSIVVDPASIAVSRRRKRKKTDRLDALKLLACLVRHHRGDDDVWRVVRIPTVGQEDEREPQREREELCEERTRHRNRIKSYLARLGIRVRTLRGLPEVVGDLRTLWGGPVPSEMALAICRECERLELVEQHLSLIDAEERERLAEPRTEMDAMASTLVELKGVGVVGAMVVVKELLGWRDFKNRREVGGASGLTGTPYDTGESSREQGISKAGNRRIRRIMIELAWSWLRYQPDSPLTHWFLEKFTTGGKRSKRKGIVALARRLLIELWKLLRFGVLPEGVALYRSV
jgi:transposase